MRVRTIQHRFDFNLDSGSIVLGRNSVGGVHDASTTARVVRVLHVVVLSLSFSLVLLRGQTVLVG